MGGEVAVDTGGLDPSVESSAGPVRRQWLLSLNLSPLVVTIFGALVLVLRSPEVFARPQFWAEDGTIYFIDAYYLPLRRTITAPYNGYLNVFPHTVAHLAAHLPLASAPLVFVITAGVVQLLPAVFFATDRFANLVPSRSFRIAISILYLVMPNVSEVNLNLTNAQWHLGLLALLVVLASPSKRLWWRAFDVVVLAVSALTGPFVLALVPVAALYWWRTRQRWTGVLVVTSVALAAVQGYELLTAPTRDLAALGPSASGLVKIFGGQVVGGTWFGVHTVANGHGAPWLFISTLMAVGGIVLGLLALTMGPLELKLFNGFAVLVFASGLASPTASSTALQWLTLSTALQSRYWFFPSLALIVDAAWLASRVRVRLSAIVGLVLLALLAVGGIREDWHMVPGPDLHWRAQVSRFSEQPPGTNQRFEILPPGWSFVLTRK